MDRRAQYGLSDQSPLHEKMYQIPAVYYESWLNQCGDTLKNKKILDFGCGEGLATLGLSLFCSAESVLGVDIGEDFRQLDNLLQANGLIRPKTVGDIDFEKIEPCSDLGEARFDVAVSWSVLEHVSKDIFDTQIKMIVRALKPGGYFIVQIAPLYYSPFGSHLFNVHKPWQHLIEQTNLLQNMTYTNQEKESANHMWNCFATLNRFTDADFVTRINQAGLEILRTYETFTNLVPEKSLTAIFQEEQLTKEQILLVCKKQ